MRKKIFDEKITYHIGGHMAEKLRRVAARTGLTQSEIARRCLVETLPRFERAKILGSPPPEEKLGGNAA